MKLIDSHAHVNFKEFKDEYATVMQRARDAGVGIVNVGTNFETSKRSVELAEQYDDVWAAIGLHPIHLARDIVETATFDGREYSFKTKAEQFDKRRFFEIAESKKVVAVGESGLDYFHLDDFKSEHMTADEFVELQKETLYEILGFAREIGRPHIFHCRDAYDDFVEIIKDFSSNADGGSGEGWQVRGVVHCFTGTMEQAEKILALGLLIGFTGIVTFPNAKSLQEIAKYVPLDRMLIETDAPFLAPQPVRGKRNEPAYVRFVAEKIAELKGVSFEEVSAQTIVNTRTLFSL